MASSPKKGHRPAVRLEQPPHISPVIETPTPALDVAAPVAEVSAPALLAAEGVEPVTPPLEEMVEAAAEVVETQAEAVESVAQRVETQAAEAVAPAPVAAIPPVKVEAPLEIKALGDNMRKLVETSLVESRAKFAQVQTAASEASAAVEASYDAARGGVVAFNVKAIEAFKAGADANFDLIASMASAKSLSELVTLQSEFARKRYEETSSHARALAELARKVADETFSPLKAHVAKTFKVA